MNELYKSKSPYLLSHKDNPIEWKLWNDETLNYIRRQDKPVFLSIGYFTCHWCHVMAREVFEDEEVARILNENFVCIKVDREENPDIDGFYINALGLLNDGNAGWPANLFLTQELKPFFGITYLPKKHFINLVNKIIQLWKYERQSLIEYAEKIYSYLSTNYLEYIDKDLPKSLLNINELENFFYNCDKFIFSRLDSKGGFSFRPKFPPHQILEYLLLRMEDTPSKYVLECIDRTLSNCILGGMYDVVDGGFCRYSVDENWMIPHFEKMLYDNALLLYIYSHASEIYKSINYQKSVIFEYISLKTFEFLLNFLYSGNAFYSSLSAESRDEGLERDEEGAYYLFSEEEVKYLYETLGSEFHDLFGTFKFVNFHTNYQGFIVHFKNQNILYDNIQRVEKLRERLKGIRQKKNKPYLDNKIILSWNAMLAFYLLKSYELKNYKQFFDVAKNIIEFILTKMMKEDNFYRISVDGESYGDALLEDYLWLSLALEKYYQIVKDQQYLELAKSLLKRCKEYFFKDNVFYNSKLFLSFDIFDNSIHSNNSLALLVQYILDGKIDNEDLVLKLFSFCREGDSGNILHLASFLYFLDFYKISKNAVKTRLTKKDNCYEMEFINLDNNVSIEPRSVKINGQKDIVLQVCDKEKCFEVRKITEF